jgi:DNA-binding transcriptional regulator GbsR (MarR family)
MTERPDHSKLALFVEQMGRLWENEGFPRIAGRIFGLLAANPEPFSLDEMAGALAVSKASISTDARRLEQIGLLLRIARPGDRRDYYALAADAPARMLALRLDAVRQFETAFNDLRREVDLHPAAAERLERFDRAHQRVMSALSAALDDLRDDCRQGEHVVLPHTGTL